MLAFNNTYLRNGLLEPTPADRMLLNLNPDTDVAHKQQFYKRVRSQMIAQDIRGCLYQASINMLMTVKKKFSWHDSNVNIFFDGAMMLHLVMVEYNPKRTLVFNFCGTRFRTPSWLFLTMMCPKLWNMQQAL